MKAYLDRWLVWCVAAVGMLPLLFVWAPEVINAVNRFNLRVEKDLALWVISLVLDPETLRAYSKIEWAKDRFDAVVNFAIGWLPPKKRAHAEALIHLRFHWHILVAESMVLVFATRASLKAAYKAHRFYRKRRAKRIESICQVSYPKSKVGLSGRMEEAINATTSAVEDLRRAAQNKPPR